MAGSRRRSSLHREAGTAGNDDSDFGARRSLIMLKSCQTEYDRRLPPVDVTVTKCHVSGCDDHRINTPLKKKISHF